MLPNLEPVSNVQEVNRGAKPAALVVTWPNYSKGNPYQELLYHKNGLGVRYYFGDINAAISLLESNLAPVPVVFHIQWLTPIFKDATSAAEAMRRSMVFVAKLGRFQDLGGSVVWTVHNAVSHEAQFREVELELSMQVARAADVIHVHDEGAIDEIEGFYLAPHKVVVAQHGHYEGSYSDAVTCAEARSCLELEDTDDVCLFLGQVRPYKGVEELLAAFRTLRASRPQLKLLIVGSGADRILREAEPSLTGEELAAIRTEVYFVPPERLQIYLRAADFMILPYRQILTSGSLLLALSFGLPVAAPNVSMVRNVLKDQRFGVLMPQACDAADVQEAISKLLARKENQELAIEPEAHRQLMEDLTWEDFSLSVVGPALKKEQSTNVERMIGLADDTALAPNVTLEDYLTLSQSDQFDKEWFAKAYPMLVSGARDAADSYLAKGRKAGGRPNHYFDPSFYRKHFADARASEIDPFLHYLKFGQKNGRPANPAEQAHNLAKEFPRGAQNSTIYCLFRKGKTTELDCAALRDAVAQWSRAELVCCSEISTSYEEPIQENRELKDKPSTDIFDVLTKAAKSSRDGLAIVIEIKDTHSNEELSTWLKEFLAGIKGTTEIILPDNERENDAPAELIAAVPHELLSRILPAYRPLEVSLLPRLLAIRARQIMPSLELRGGDTENELFNYGQSAARLLHDAGVASVISADLTSATAPAFQTMNPACDGSMFDLADALIEGAPSQNARREMTRETARARAAYIATRKPDNLIPDHFEHTGGPPHAPEPGPGPVVVSCVKNDSSFIGPFIEHYRAMGARRIVFIDDNSDRGVHLDYASEDVTVLRPRKGRFFTAKTLWMEVAIRGFVRQGEWVVTVDADEFFDPQEGCADFVEAIAALNAHGRDYLPTILIDLLPSPDNKDLSSGDMDFLKQLSHMSWQEKAMGKSYELHETVKWGFGRYALISWRVDARHHLLKSFDSLRKVSLFRFRPGVHLNQGFHSLMDRTGHHYVREECWADGPVGFLRHYKFAKFLVASEKRELKDFAGVYFDDTAHNLAAAYRIGPDEIARRIAEAGCRPYNVSELTKLVDDVRKACCFI